MNIITDKLPDSIIVSGSKYPINTDFRAWIKIEELLSGGITEENILKMLKLCYVDILPANIEIAINEILRFLIGYKDEKASSEPVKRSSPIYSFSHDSNYIFSDFVNEYNINLSTADLHWFVFKSLLEGLPEDCKFMKILGYRSIKLSDIKDKNQKKFYKKMKQLYKLPDLRTEEQKEIDMIANIEGFF